jgi:hypothetical protein
MESVMRAARVGLAVLVFITISAFTQYAFAHDGTWGSTSDPCSIDGFGTGYELDLLHNDAPDWKGWAGLIAINWCGDTWGDFHFRVKDICSPWHTSDVDFTDDFVEGQYDYRPQLYVWDGGWVQQMVTWDIAPDGETMDLFFYNNPIEQGEIALIKVYTDNTLHSASWFTIGGYATPVPEPATVALLGLGAMALIKKRRA